MAKQAPRADLNKPINDYFHSIPNDTLRETATAFRTLVVQHAPQAEAAIKWGKPTWTDHGILCAVAAFKSHVTLQFFDAGTSLKDPKNILEGTGKGCRHIKAKSPKDIDKPYIGNLIKEAVAFNRS